MAKYILKNHKGLDSVEKCYSFITNMESVLGKDIGTILSEYNKFPCFKKIRNDGFFEKLKELGKVTDTFLSYYDGIEHIARRQLFNPQALTNVIKKLGKSEEFARKVVVFLMSFYIMENEEAQKEVYFMLYNYNKALKKSANLFMTEIVDIDKDVMNYILCKTAKDEDGETPMPSVEGATLLESISRKNIVLDIAMQDDISGILNDIYNLSEETFTKKRLLDIANLLDMTIVE